MQKVEIRYNPYKMETVFFIDGVNVAKTPDYSDIGYFTENKMPLQTWLEPIPYRQWNGILAALKSDDCEDSIHFDFYGRQIDFDDLVRACESQNREREYKLKLDFNLHAIRSDVETSHKIEKVKNTLLSKEFAEIMADYPKDSAEFVEYRKIEQKYNRAKNKEFRVVFAGLYSSGKSMIINTLIRHDILPVSDATCTAKVCRIMHDSDLGDKVTLECFDKNNKSVIGLHEFDSDEICLKFFSSLVPLNPEEQPEVEFDSIEIHANLSHLYPSEDMEREFTLTIVDTPGTNSSKTIGISDNAYDNLDKKITIDAITDQNKDMVVICVDAQNYENESLGDLLREIQEVSEEDKGSFTDRFMFVANKCDLLKYKSGENIEQHKGGFSKYLMDKKRWGIKNNESTVEFVPRIFMTSAYTEYAVQKNAAKFSKEEVKESTEKRDLKKAYMNYMEEVTAYDNENYMLSQACDIPAYRKQEFADKFEQLVDDSSYQEAVSIQTGIPCIEGTIRDYIERYAFPFKVRDLLESFEILLDVVNADIIREAEQLQNAEKNLGENTSQRKEAEKEKGEAGKRKRKIEKIKASVANAKPKIEGVKIKGLMKIAEDFETAFELNEKIIWIRDNLDETQSKETIDPLFEVIETLLTEACDNADDQFAEFENRYKKKINGILDDLKSMCEGEFIDDDYSFQNSITMRQIAEMNIHKLREDVDETEERELVKRDNPIKKQTYKKYQIFKRLKQWWADDYVYDTKKTYSLAPLNQFLTDKLHEFRQLCMDTEKAYSDDLVLIKKRAVEKIDSFSKDIDELERRIEEFEKKLGELRNNRQQLDQEIAKAQKRSEMMLGLREDLSFGGNEDV